MNDRFIARNSIFINGVLLNLPGKLLKSTQHSLAISNYFNKEKLWIFTIIVLLLGMIAQIQRFLKQFFYSFFCDTALSMNK